jgi:hypothetical protein
MQISFDTENFASRYRGDLALTNVLHYLMKHGCLSDEVHYPSIERVTCRTPRSTIRYCRYFAGKGVSPETEKVFLRNPRLGVRYLKMVRRSEFSDPDVQRRFRKKFRSDPHAAYEWSTAFNTRLTEEEESVFRKNMEVAMNYARDVIRGKFPEKVHAMIMLASFKNMSSREKRSLENYVRFAEGK